MIPTHRLMAEELLPAKGRSSGNASDSAFDFCQVVPFSEMQGLSERSSGWLCKILFVGLVALAGFACRGGSVSAPPETPELTYREPYPWPLSTPAAQGMDTVRVAAGLQQIKINSFIYSFLVVKNDSLVVEYYVGNYQKDNDFEIFSASKSFTSALVGIAIDRGIIQSAQDKILSFFPDFDTTNVDPRKRDWTIEHFLTMRSGIDWDESADHSAIFTTSANWMYAALGLPLKYAPGEEYVYTTPNANVLSGILTRATGMSTYKFADNNLFGPLRISVRTWLADPQGIYAGGTGMRFTPRDLARFGELYLHDGFLDGRQIVSRDWIRQSLVPRNPQNTIRGSFSAVNYGYFWWTDYEDQDSLFMAAGFGGQAVYVDRGQNMIIVTIANPDAATRQGDINELNIIDILKKYFL
jgi:CubicO group peptidase (beta-lactamase class C family)